MQTSATVQIQEDRKASERRLRAELKEQVNTSIIPVPIYLVPVLRCWLLVAGMQTSATTPIQAAAAKRLKAELKQQHAHFRQEMQQQQVSVLVSSVYLRRL